MRYKYLFFCALYLSLNWQCRSPQKPVVLDAYQTEPGFKLEVVAAEPLLNTPVAMCFDERGRIWAAEMPGYMADLDNSAENKPVGAIVILEDTDGDGRMDLRKPFLEKLVLPRAIALVYGGLLYAEPPKLWFVEINHDHPGKRTLVDSLYATGGNVEHQPNGLLLNLDNWIYSAKSDVRYRRINGRWIKEKTAFRGQWGITHDDYGRLYYNDNSNQLQGDWVLPNALLRNPYFQPTHGINVQINTDQRVYPLQPTAVNRGYQAGMLDSLGILINFTSACGPWLYRGDQFPHQFYGNAFVCGPEANLVKRNRFLTQTPHTRAEQAYKNREFLAATDPAFRPVNLTDGPDGALYVVDMHHGIIQHKTYMTAYLREKVQNARLDSVTGMGRILRVRHISAVHPIPPKLYRAETRDLVQLLRHPNGWVRDQAQQMLTNRGDKNTVELLQEQLQSAGDPIFVIHALWTLEGLQALESPLLQRMCRHPDSMVVTTAMHLMATVAPPAQKDSCGVLIAELSARKSPLIDLALCLYGACAGPQSFPVLSRLAKKYHHDGLYRGALVSGMSDQEKAFAEYLRGTAPGCDTLIGLLNTAAKARSDDRKAPWAQERKAGRDGLTAGLLLFNTHCAICHGPTGQGTANLAPPLDGSEFVGGHPDRLALIVLYGLEGPVTVKGTQYRFNAAMPGLAANPACSDADLAAILNFVRNAFSTAPSQVKPEQIKAMRDKKPPSGGAYTAPQLLMLFNETQ